MHLKGRSVALEELTTYQGMIILLLNSKPEIKVREIIQKLGVPKDVLVHDIQELLYHDHPVLTKKNSEGMLVEEADILIVNSNFSPEKGFLKFNQARTKDEVI